MVPRIQRYLEWDNPKVTTLAGGEPQDPTHRQGQAVLVPLAQVPRHVEAAAVGQNSTIHRCWMVGDEERPTGHPNAMYSEEDWQAMDSRRLLEEE